MQRQKYHPKLLAEIRELLFEEEPNLVDTRGREDVANYEPHQVGTRRAEAFLHKNVTIQKAMHFISHIQTLLLLSSLVVPSQGLRCELPQSLRPWSEDECGEDIPVSIDVGGLSRSALVHLPPLVAGSRTSTDPLPLLFDLHALGSGASAQKFLAGFDDIANKEQFIVVRPQGYADSSLPREGALGLFQKNLGTSPFQGVLNLVDGFTSIFNRIVDPVFKPEFLSGKSWNAGGCCGDASGDKIDEIRFFRQLLTYVETTLAKNEGFHVDMERIYVTGMSNGGFMTHRVACEMSDIVAAVAPVAGVMFDNTTPKAPSGFEVDETFKCEPKNPVPLLHIHSKYDLVVTGPDVDQLVGLIDNFVPIDPGFPSVFDSVDFWRNNNGVSESDGVTSGDVTVHDGITLGREHISKLPGFDLLKIDDLQLDFLNLNTECTKYFNSNGNSAIVEFCLHNSPVFLGHCWPSEKISLGDCGNGIGSQYIWDFFKQHKRSIAKEDRDEL